MHFSQAGHVLKRRQEQGADDVLKRFMHEYSTSLKEYTQPTSQLLTNSSVNPFSASCLVSTAFYPHSLPAYIFCALNIATCLIFLFRLTRKRDWYALVLPIGCFIQGIGYVNKVRFHSNPTFGLYFSGDLFIQIAPVAYLAFNYILLGRLANVLESDPSIYKTKRRLVGISPRRVKALFVWSDVLTLLIQVAGGLMKISNNVANLGHYIGLIGIAVQLLSYIIFSNLLRRCQKACPNLKRGEGEIGRDAYKLLLVLWISSAFIIIRLLYRIIELAPGMDSSISASEACFYLLDAVPLLLAVSPYAVAWPSDVLPQISHRISSTKSESDWPLSTAP